MFVQGDQYTLLADFSTFNTHYTFILLTQVTIIPIYECTDRFSHLDFSLCPYLDKKEKEGCLGQQPFHTYIIENIDSFISQKLDLRYIYISLN